jgi:hypothetical protein
MFWSKVDSKRAQGTAQFWRSQCGQLLFIQWMDKTRVCVLSSFHEGASGVDYVYAFDSRGGPLGYVVLRQRKSQSGAKEWARTELPQPAALYDYSKNMGGVDDSDQVPHCSSAMTSMCAFDLLRYDCTVVLCGARWLRTTGLVGGVGAGTWPS